MPKNIQQAARYIDRVGFCLLFPIKRLPLPSLWGWLKGRPEAWGPREFSLVGTWDADSERLWDWKDELPRRRRAYYGKYFRGRGSLIAPTFLPCFYRLAENYPEVSPLHDHEPSAEQLYRAGKISADAYIICKQLYNGGPLPVLELRHACGFVSPRRNLRFKRALEELQRRLLIVHWGTAQETHGWGSSVYELIWRAFPRVARTAAKLSAEEARQQIVHQYRQVRPQATSVDLVRVFGWSRAAAEQALSAIPGAC